MDPKSDHDLLIEINTTLKRAVDDIKSLSDGTTKKIAVLEHKVEQLEITVRDAITFKKLVIWIGAAILAMLIYHLTGLKL